MVPQSIDVDINININVNVHGAHWKMKGVASFGFPASRALLSALVYAWLCLRFFSAASSVVSLFRLGGATFAALPAHSLYG